MNISEQFNVSMLLCVASSMFLMAGIVCNAGTQACNYTLGL